MICFTVGERPFPMFDAEGLCQKKLGSMAMTELFAQVCSVEQLQASQLKDMSMTLHVVS